MSKINKLEEGDQYLTHSFRASHILGLCFKALFKNDEWVSVATFKNEDYEPGGNKPYYRSQHVKTFMNKKRSADNIVQEQL